MSITHLVERMGVKRQTPPIAFIDDDLSVLTNRAIKVTKQSQVGITANPSNYEIRQKKAVIYTLRWRAKNKERSYLKWKAWFDNKRKTNEEFRNRLLVTNRKSYRKRIDLKIQTAGVDAVRAEWKEKKRAYVARKIEELGREGWNKKLTELRHARKKQ